MKRRWVIWASVLVAALLFSGVVSAQPKDLKGGTGRPAVAERRVALVIGNARYPGSELGSTRSDAQAMARTLRDLGFDVIEGYDLSRRDLERELKVFARKLPTHGVGLVYYVGYGMQVDKVNYMVPVDAKVATAADIKKRGVAVSTLLGEMKPTKGRLDVAVFDVRQNLEWSRFLGSNDPVWLDERATSGRVVASSVATEVTATDGGNVAQGVYCEALLRQLDTPGLTVTEVFSRAGDDVQGATQRLVRPSFTGLLREPWVLRGNGGGELVNAPPPLSGRTGAAATGLLYRGVDAAEVRRRLEADGWEVLEGSVKDHRMDGGRGMVYPVVKGAVGGAVSVYVYDVAESAQSFEQLMKQQGAAVGRDGRSVMAVLIPDDPKGSQRLFDSLMGAQVGGNVGNTGNAGGDGFGQWLQGDPAGQGSNAGKGSTVRSLSESDMRRRLRDGGWEILGEPQPQVATGMKGITFPVVKGAVGGAVSIYEYTDASTGKLFQDAMLKQGAAAERDGGKVVTALIPGDAPASKKLLDFIMGR